MALILVSLSISVLVFLAVMISLNHFFRAKIRIMNRVKNITTKQEQVSLSPKKKKTASISKKLSPLLKTPILKLLSVQLSVAGIPLRADEFLIIWILITIIPACFVFVITEEWIAALSFVICGLALPIVFLQVSKAKRLRLLDKQLVDSLIIIGNCLRAGLTFQQALDSIANNMAEPISKEFERVLKEVKFGLTIEKALTNMVDRLKNKDINLLVSAVLIQRQVGGNLSEILDSIADTIKERIGIKEEVKVLTATGRTSGAVVGLLPVAAFLALMLLNPKYIQGFFQSDMGTILLIVAASMEFIGFFIVSRIVNIKF